MRCPQGKNTTPMSLSIQILHVRSSFNRRFSRSKSEALADVDGESCSSSADEEASGNFRFFSSLGLAVLDLLGTHVVSDADVDVDVVLASAVDDANESLEKVDCVDVWLSEKGDCVDKFSTLAMSSCRRCALKAASISC